MCSSTLNTHSKDFICTYNERVTSRKRKNRLVLARSVVACSIHIAVILYVRIMNVWRHARGKITSSPHFDLPSAAELWELRWQCTLCLWDFSTLSVTAAVVLQEFHVFCCIVSPTCISVIMTSLCITAEKSETSGINIHYWMELGTSAPDSYVLSFPPPTESLGTRLV